MSKTLSIAAQCAASIRLDLKAKFPNTKFRVRSENYAGGDSVNINYVDGVPESEIQDVVSKYQQGHFDGMTDMYEYTNSDDSIPQSKYIMVNREISEENKESVRQNLMKKFGLPDFEDKTVMAKCHCWSDQFLWQHIKDLTFSN